MATLRLKFKDVTISDYRLEQGQSLTIGRRTANDVVIDNLAVSGSHAKIDSLEEGFLLTDLQSKNGTFVNGKRITSHWLKNWDVITVGKHTLYFTMAKGEAPPPEQQVTDKTMVLDTDEYRSMLDKSQSEVSPGSSQAEQISRKDQTGILSFLKGGRGEVILKKKLVKLGRDPLSDIVVSGLTVGKTAATISKRPSGFYLSYVQGMARPKVNGKAVKESVMLEEFDIIELGSAKMEFIIRE